jgi:hypothetical protein
MKYLLLLLIFPTLALGQSHGCYTVDGINCYNSTVPGCFNDFQTNQASYGITVATLCMDFNYNYNELNKCISKNTNLVSTGKYAISELSKRDKLIAKLKKACGSRCKSFK